MKNAVKLSAAMVVMLSASTAMAQSGATGGANVTTQPGVSTNTTTGNAAAGADTTANRPLGAGRVATGSSVSNGTWDTQNTFWRDNYNARPYFNNARPYSDMTPAYRYGWDTYNQSNTRAYNDLDQEQLRKGWEQARGNSTMEWKDAEPAVRDSYNRMYNNRAM